MAITQLPDGRWMVYYRDPSVHPKYIKREYFGRGADAENRAKARDIEVGARRNKNRGHADGPAFKDLAYSYSNNKVFSLNSQRHLGIRLSANILPHFGHLPAVALRDDDVDSYIKLRRSKGVKFATIRRELTDVKSILNFATRRRPPLIPFNPIRDYRLPREDLDIIPPPTSDEIKAILQHAAPHLIRAVTVAGIVGCRPGGELLRLTWDDVNFPASIITITSSHKGGPSKRAVFLRPEFAAILMKWKKEDSGLETKHIVNYNGKSIKRLNTAWWKALDRAGIRPWLKKEQLKNVKNRRRIRLYDLRHLFVSIMLDSGMDPKTVSEVVGSSPNTIMKYYRHASLAAQRRAIMQTEPIIPLE